MSDEQPKYGPVEAAVRADIERIGTMRHGQQTLAATAIVLAHAMDDDPDEKLARELRMIVLELFGMPNPVAPLQPVEQPASLDSIDELKARRHRREQGESG